MFLISLVLGSWFFVLLFLYSLPVRIQSLSLEHFRNYESLALDLSGSLLHLFIGPNGSGKTNILESLSILSLTKSSLGIEEEFVQQWDAPYYRVKGRAVSDAGEETTVEVVYQSQPRKQKGCFLNDVRVPISQVVGVVPSVLFLPQDLQLFSGPPAERRRFIDQLLSQVSGEYLRALTEYQKYLKQRNVLLKHIAQGTGHREDLRPWDEQLAETGAVVTESRLQLMETFGLTLTDEIAQLGEQWDDVRIVYDRSSEGRDAAAIRADLLAALRQSQDRDILLQSTGNGPHREDWALVVNGHRLATFASRGQQRTCVLALLFLEASFVELRRGERPIILLDDVFSELDDRHQEGVMKAFAEHQVFITGTHLPKNMPEAQVWGVERGNVELKVEH